MWTFEGDLLFKSTNAPPELSFHDMELEGMAPEELVKDIAEPIIVKIMREMNAYESDLVNSTPHAAVELLDN